ncbi:hypothetical protein [Pseudomonas simiae]|uniref:Uncharacterized protein n=2 Tax=Pseudomonas simiae TaxID=321846 RepID=A0ABS9G6L7_9PSED|nr:hypothetical protein [Pseudomonas simiae]MCF5188320.1 hypothetical protein [Pseudomonas simiae]MCF5288682.1 hypothetical protein [Pseudomonas simiae]MCF5320664.1 hypothetical protein [Pseudomonas simiae]MCF5337723.1 hypothetical protein [Pseudomonas simiae]MCF5343129.1 hypothetical protein [Pseudomonas simiae]
MFKCKIFRVELLGAKLFMNNRESVVNSHSMGIFKASNWKKEGDGLLVAAKALRQQWLSNREEVIKVITVRSPRSSEVFTKDSALARSSMLLLGYSVEMFLKGGVVKLHTYCSEEMVERLMRKLGHDYESMAKRLEVKLESDQLEQLNGLSKSVVNDARYPATPSLGKDFFEQINQITRYNHRQPNFERLVVLVEQIRDFARKIDSDSLNPTCFQHHWTDWGYVVARCGGNLAPTIIFRHEDQLTESDLRSAIDAVVMLSTDFDCY